MNKLRLILLLILVLTVLPIAAAVWFFATLQIEPINDSAPTPGTPTESAKITAIFPNEHWVNPVGMTMAFWFQVNVLNDGDKALENLTLNLTIKNVSTEMYGWGTYEPIGTIQPGEIAMVQVYVLTELNRLNQVSGKMAVIQLTLGDRILDEGSLDI